MLPGSPNGRPRTIKTPEEFDNLVDAYVVACHMNDQPMDTVNMCLFLGFNSTQSLYDYGSRKGFEDFAASVKRARFIVEGSYNQLALKGGGAGPIFLLKASYGYVDKQVVDVNAKVDIKMVIDPEDEDA
jgi:hypothetical protein